MLAGSAELACVEICPMFETVLASCVVANRLPMPGLRSYVGASRLRLMVAAGSRLETVLLPIIRQLNYQETTDLGPEGQQSGPGGLKEICLIDGSLDDALSFARSLPQSVTKILTTPDISFSLRQRCAEAGISAIIADPIDPNELADWLEYFEDRDNSDRPRILIIDDDILAAECAGTLLASRGIDAEVVDDPEQALEALDHLSFDLVLMDLEMPRISGVDLARMIRQNRRHLSVPIVFLSAEGDTEIQLRARQWGGDDFISKRVAPELLPRLVELRVERARVLRTLIERDGLTGLVDHRRFIERASLELVRSARTGNECALVMIDIDHFKTINDTWGHPIGDLVLRRLSQTLTAWLRRTDVVGRYGGEEFGVLMLDTPPERCAPVIDAFREHFAEMEFAAPNGSFRVTLSAGIAGSRGKADTAALVAEADAALYRAKNAGRNRVALADRRRFEALAAGGLAHMAEVGSLLDELVFDGDETSGLRLSTRRDSTP